MSTVIQPYTSSDMGQLNEEAHVPAYHLCLASALIATVAS